MKNACVALVMLCASLTAFAATLNPSDYTITVSVVASENTFSATGPGDRQCIMVMIDGKRYQLTGFSLGVLALGDYKAKLSETHRNGYDIYRTYQFLMPDGRTRDFTLTGIPE